MRASVTLIFAASLCLAPAALAADVAEHVIATPGLAPVTVLVGEASAVEAGLRARAAAIAQEEARLAEQARTDSALAAMLALPDYPVAPPAMPAMPADPPAAVVAQPPMADPILPAPDYPPAALALIAPDRAPAPAAVGQSVALTDIAGALRGLLDKPQADRFHPRLSRALRDDLAALYAARGFAPLWLDDQGPGDRALAVQRQLQRAGDDGLDEAAYRLGPVPDEATGRAAFDLALTQAVLLYARDAQGARIDARRISNLIDPEIALSSPAEVIAALMQADDPAARLQALNPQHAGYRALRNHLMQLRAIAGAAPPSTPAALVDADAPQPARVRRRTAALAVAASTQEADLIANMERWRWLPRELGDRHVFVNIPEYRVRVIEKGAVIHEARAIVGKPETQTPVFSDRMQFLVVNPSWFVPPSIMKKEFLPKLAEDPAYAERRGYQVIRRGNQIYVKQPPGERNALGHIKFMFPNRHAVYLHDTPSRNLFGSDRRAFSHGCVRVDQPFRLAEMVLGRDNGWTEQRLRGLVGRGEQSVKLSQPLPVHLGYFTSFVDEMGRLQTRDDLYGHHRRVKAALGLE